MVIHILLSLHTAFLLLRLVNIFNFHAFRFSEYQENLQFLSVFVFNLHGRGKIFNWEVAICYRPTK